MTNRMTARLLVVAGVLVPLSAISRAAQPEPPQRRIVELEDCAAAALAAADFDADGWCDLAVLTSAARLLVFRNSRGELEPFGDHPAGIAVLNRLLLLETGDVDGDGAADLVAGAVNGREIAVVYGRGDGSFEEPVLAVTSRRSRSFALAAS